MHDTGYFEFFLRFILLHCNEKLRKAAGLIELHNVGGISEWHVITGSRETMKDLVLFDIPAFFE